MKTLSKFLLGALALGMHASLASAQTRLTSYDDLVQRVSAAEPVAAPAAAPAPAAHCCPTVDCCNQGCNDNCERGHLYGLLEAVIVTPYFSRNDAFNTNPGGDELVINQLTWDTNITPRLELGYLGACDRLGFRLRYWHFDENQGLSAGIDGDAAIVISPTDPEIDVTDDGDSDTFNINHGLEMNVLDLEAMKRSGSFCYSGGIRWAKMEQSWTAADSFESIASNHDFKGFGPTFAVEGRHRLGDGGLVLFASGRASILFGESTWNAADTDSGDVDATISRTNDGDLLPVGEVQVGVEWSREMGSGMAFLRLALEGQYWVGAGSGMSTNVMDDDVDNGPAVIADPQEPDMGFLGFTIGVGFAR